MDAMISEVREAAHKQLIAKLGTLMYANAELAAYNEVLLARVNELEAQLKARGNGTTIENLPANPYEEARH